MTRKCRYSRKPAARRSRRRNPNGSRERLLAAIARDRRLAAQARAAGRLKLAEFYERQARKRSKLAVSNPRRRLSVSDWHQLRIARQTLRMSDPMAAVMGEPNKAEAQAIIRRLDKRYAKRNPYAGHDFGAAKKQAQANADYFGEPYVVFRDTSSRLRVEKVATAGAYAGANGIVFRPNASKIRREAYGGELYGHGHRANPSRDIKIVFNKRGKPEAYRWDMRQIRWFRMPIAKARADIASGAARDVTELKAYESQLRGRVHRPWYATNPRKARVFVDRSGRVVVESGTWVDSPLCHADGNIVYDFPERIPAYARAEVRKKFDELARAGRKAVNDQRATTNPPTPLGNLTAEDVAAQRRLVDAIRPGDKVTILVPGGRNRDGSIEWKERAGRAVMHGPAGWVLNLGGAHGIPGIAGVENTVRVTRGRR